MWSDDDSAGRARSAHQDRPRSGTANRRVPAAVLGHKVIDLLELVRIVLGEEPNINIVVRGQRDVGEIVVHQVQW